MLDPLPASTGTVRLIGVPLQCGAGQPGCIMGPDAYRTAGLGPSLAQLGWRINDVGNLSAAPLPAHAAHPDHLKLFDESNGWVATLTEAAHDAARSGEFCVFMGGDHLLSAGTVAGLARHAHEIGQPQFVLWLDAHPDLHSLDTTASGHLHGTPVGYFTGQPGFDAFPPLTHKVPPAQVAMMGLRSVDAAERARIAELGIEVADMRAIDEEGVRAPLMRFLDRVAAAGGRLHVSLDVDFLDPPIAPAVGTTVPGGATFREAHLIMELLHDSALVTSLDLVELNPFLDERGKTAHLMCDLTASLFGRSVLSRPTRSLS